MRNPAPCPRELALAHLLLRLRPLSRALRTAIALRDGDAQLFHAAGAVPNAITRGHAEAVLDTLDELVSRRGISSGTARLDDDELARESTQRKAAHELQTLLPLDALQRDLELDAFECEVLVLCAALELDSDFEWIVSYVQDHPTRRAITVELACGLTAVSISERVARRALLGACGRLRRLGLITTSARESGLRDELRLTPACLEALLGTSVDLPLVFRDPGEVRLEQPAIVPADDELLARIGDAVRTSRVEVIAIWGAPRLARDVVARLGRHANLTIRRHVAPLEVAASAAAAAALGTLLWIDLDELGEPPPTGLAEICSRARVPLVLTGAQPWRPTELLASRRTIEVPLIPPDHATRMRLWNSALPYASQIALERVSASFHFDAREVRAASNTASTAAAMFTNGHAVSLEDVLPASCVTVARKHGERHTTLVMPRRCADDLVLPPDLHARVLDLVHYFRALPRVMDEWGFAIRTSGAGIKALFTGEPGTGKTLAAEVVAKELDLPMLKVDLARVVSKWIGETEKNLDHVFTEAHDSHAVLFFDEAEALFGARGDVRHGTDRYANLEVSYLLQRLEAHSGVVILATNLRDKIDPAFMRRFHAVIGFPRPSDKERRRMWQRVFTPAVPCSGDLDAALLARLDLTGAGIVGAAQTAALFAAHEGSAVSMRHIVRGLVRQYQREARVLTLADLGPHAVHAGT
jgi:ATPase family associated with various cellular activities (AAA)